MNSADSNWGNLFALGLVDRVGVCGTALPAVDWPKGIDPLVVPGIHRRLFGFTDPTFRRLDRPSRALVLAAAAAGIGGPLDGWFDEAGRSQTALVLETGRGCLEADLEFAAGLAQGVVRGALFPFTLPSTCLGEVALRHRLRGPTYCLASERPPDDMSAGRESLHEAYRLLDGGESAFAVAACLEVLSRPRGDIPPALLSVVALVGKGPKACLGRFEPGVDSLLDLACRHLRMPIF